MDEILSYLQSPGWWFTTVFVAVLVSLLAGYVNNRIDQWLSRSSAWYRQWRASTLARKERELEFLSTEPSILTLRTIHAIVMFLYFVVFVLIYLLLPIWANAMLASPELDTDLFRLIPRDQPTLKRLTKGMMLISGIVACFAGFRAMSLLALSVRAYKRLYDRKFAEFERNEAVKEFL